jgi:tetratricopeptide (TPR) repeat protein
LECNDCAQLQASSTYRHIIRGLCALACNDSLAARREYAGVLDAPPSEQRKFAREIEILQACFAAEIDDWQQVLDHLSPWIEAAPYPFFEFRALIYWLLARAYEHLGNDVGAASQLERLIAPDGFSYMDDAWALPLYRSMARYRLILTYCRLQRRDEALGHWNALQKELTSPDPVWLDRLENAKTALESAGAL